MGREIGDYPREPEPVEDDDATVMDYIDDVLPATDAQDEPKIPGVEAEPTSEPTSEPIVELTGVEVDSDHQELTLMMDSDNRTRKLRHHQPCLSLKTLQRPTKEWQHVTPG